MLKLNKETVSPLTAAYRNQSTFAYVTRTILQHQQLFCSISIGRIQAVFVEQHSSQYAKLITKC